MKPKEDGMKGCGCGQPVARWGVYDACHTCLREYLAVLPERPGLLIRDWQRERHARSQSAATNRAPPVSLVQERHVPAALLASVVGG